MSWSAVDGQGSDLAGARGSPAAALAAAPAAPRPVAVRGDDGSRLSVGQALGAGGDRVADLIDALFRNDTVDVEPLARSTPAGPSTLPVVAVTLRAAVAASDRVDRAWLAEVDRRRAECRRAVVDAGREEALEAALHVTMLVATELFDPRDDGDVDEHVASGARLWLLAGAVASALSGAEPDPFAGWAALLAAGWWPVGPSDGRLVVTRP